MGYANLASATKLHRANKIISDIGTNGLMMVYTGSYPGGPDLITTGTLLVSLPLSATAGVASLAVQSGVVTAPGSGGTDGVYALVITGGGGAGAVGTFTVQAGVLHAISINDPGFGYTAPPTLNGFDNAGLSGSTAAAVMTGVAVFNTISTATAVATGTAGFVRVVTSGGVPILDLDVGTTNAFSIIMNSTFLSNGGSVSCTSEILIEA